MLAVGDSVPWFVARSAITDQFRFDARGGRWTVLGFFTSIGAEGAPGRAALDSVLRLRDRFSDDATLFFGVTTDPQDERRAALTGGYLRGRLFWDTQAVISAAWKVPEGSTTVAYLVDPRLTIQAVLCPERPEDLGDLVIQALDARPAPPEPFAITMQAPVLVRPGVFEPELCRALIDHHTVQEAVAEGVMVNQGNQTQRVIDRKQKVRDDVLIADGELRAAVRTRLIERLLPEIRRAFQFQVSQIERYLIAAYDAEDGGHFNVHRDDTTKGTAHRKFAVSVNLNDGYGGGALTFPEFGPATYTPPAGGAVVFSCSLMHRALPVTAGRRYVFVPFLYDEAGAKVREQNLQFVAKEAG
ncbi:MAG: 2OG-Fe(II) oxygenase [Alphaproteobacteria bacterium]|nr:2OG-Fe(II) oxygenase [Alphaproteobacteria bacterium]